MGPVLLLGGSGSLCLFPFPASGPCALAPIPGQPNLCFCHCISSALTLSWDPRDGLGPPVSPARSPHLEIPAQSGLHGPCAVWPHSHRFWASLGPLPCDTETLPAHRLHTQPPPAHRPPSPGVRMGLPASPLLRFTGCPDSSGWHPSTPALELPGELASVSGGARVCLRGSPAFLAADPVFQTPSRGSPTLLPEPGGVLPCLGSHPPLCSCSSPLPRTSGPLRPWRWLWPFFSGACRDPGILWPPAPPVPRVSPLWWSTVHAPCWHPW